MGPMAFCTAIMPLINKLQEHVTWQGWYMDDGCIIGTPAELAAAITLIQVEAGKMGLLLNPSKCTIWGPAGASVVRESPEGHVLKNIPVVSYNRGPE